NGPSAVESRHPGRRQGIAIIRRITQVLCGGAEVRDAVAGPDHESVRGAICQPHARRKVIVRSVPRRTAVRIEISDPALQVWQPNLGSYRIDYAGIEIGELIVSFSATPLKLIAYSIVEGQPARDLPGVLDIPRVVSVGECRFAGAVGRSVAARA